VAVVAGGAGRGRRSVRACVAKCGHACVFVLGTRAAWIGFLIYDG
jgi:hypothetical protein